MGCSSGAAGTGAVRLDGGGGQSTEGRGRLATGHKRRPPHVPKPSGFLVSVPSCPPSTYGGAVRRCSWQSPCSMEDALGSHPNPRLRGKAADTVQGHVASEEQDGPWPLLLILSLENKEGGFLERDTRDAPSTDGCVPGCSSHFAFSFHSACTLSHLSRVCREAWLHIQTRTPFVQHQVPAVWPCLVSHACLL